MTVIELDPDQPVATNLVGPVIRSGRLADSVIDAVEADNPDLDVHLVDRDDYVRIHTKGRCRLTRASLVQALGEPIDLAAIEIDMPSFKGRLQTRTDEYVWFLNTPDSDA